MAGALVTCSSMEGRVGLVGLGFEGCTSVTRVVCADTNVEELEEAVGHVGKIIVW